MTIDAVEWLRDSERSGRPMPGTTMYMFGRDSYYDGPCAMDYDPWVHAEDLGVPVIYRSRLPRPEMVACYSRRHSAIFALPNLHHATERCGVAHEIVHHENEDVGTTRSQEDRADRVAARRLIRPSRLEQMRHETEDLGVMALELGVTERLMRIYERSVMAGHRGA